MKIGIIFTAFNASDTIEKCLSTWIKIKLDEIKNEHEFVYSCVCVPFEKFNNDPPDSTVDIIKSMRIMDFLYSDSKYISEIEARGLCLEFLKDSNCDIIWQVDADEFYTVEQIQKIINYIEKNKNIGWFSLSFKNYIFDENTFLKNPFTPARIFRTSLPPYKLGSFREDNNLTYIYDNIEIPDVFVKNKTMSSDYVWVDHYSWLSNSRSKKKVQYQLSRWGQCSFQWNEIENKLEFNLEYYKKLGKSFPEIINNK